jgi:hypothetical protein
VLSGNMSIQTQTSRISSSIKRAISRLHFRKPLPGEQERYIRLSYSGIEQGAIAEGLAHFKEYAENFLYHKKENIA